MVCDWLNDEDEAGPAPPAPADAMGPYRRLAAAVIRGALVNPALAFAAPPEDCREHLTPAGLAWMQSPTGRFWLWLAGLHPDTAIARAEQFLRDRARHQARPDDAPLTAAAATSPGAVQIVGGHRRKPPIGAEPVTGQRMKFTGETSPISPASRAHYRGTTAASARSDATKAIP